MILNSAESDSLLRGMQAFLAFSVAFNAWIDKGGDARLMEAGPLMDLLCHAFEAWDKLADRIDPILRAAAEKAAP